MPLLIIVIIFALFALIHSALAAGRTKDFAIRLAGQKTVRAFYRFAYVLISSVTALAAFYLIARLPDAVIWDPPLPVRIIMSLIQLSGVMLGLAAFSGMDFREFMGVKQTLDYFRGAERPPGDEEGINQRLITRSLYAHMRHPLYTAGILIFTFFPVVTRNWLAVSVLADLYFVFGAFVEERRLVKRFGRQYRDYMKKTPRFIPKIR